MKTFIIFVSFLFLVNGILDLPDNFPSCRRYGTKFEECMINATNKLRSLVAIGIPELLPPFQNFTVPEIIIDQRNNRALSFYLQITNLTIIGLDQYEFKRFKFNFTNEPITAFVDVHFPENYIQGKYFLKGNLFFANLIRNGTLHANISGASCTCNITLEVFKKDNIEYIRIISIDPKLHVGNVTDLKFDGHFDEIKELEPVTNNLVINNFQVLLEEFSPAIEKIIAIFLTDILDKFTSQIPYDNLYPK